MPDPFDVLDANLCLIESQDSGEQPPGSVDILSGARDFGRIRRHIRERAVGAETRMRLIGATRRVRRDSIRAVDSGVKVPFIENCRFLHVGVPHVFEQTVSAWKRRRGVPRDVELLCGPHGIPFVLGDDANEVVPPDDTCAGEYLKWSSRRD